MSLKACIRRVIEKIMSCKLSKRMYYYTRKHGNHFYQCFMQFYIILIHKFVVSRSFKILFARIFRTIDPLDYWLFWPLTLRTNELTRKTRGLVGWACVAHVSFCFEETLYRTCHRCFIQNFNWYGQLVLTNAGRQVMAKSHIAFGKVT